MNRLLAMLVALLLGSAMPVGTVAAAERASPENVTQLILVFFSNVSRGLLPKRVVAEDKEWKVVKEAEQQQDVRRSHEERRREAYRNLEAQEREARLAREEYRRETRNLLQARHGAWQRQADERAKAAREGQEERLRAAQRRMQDQEREVQKAKEAYKQLARMAREERRRETGTPGAGG